MNTVIGSLSILLIETKNLFTGSLIMDKSYTKSYAMALIESLGSITYVLDNLDYDPKDIHIQESIAKGNFKDSKFWCDIF